MANSVIETVSLAFVTRLATVTEANGYNVTLCDVVRDTRKGHNPRHLLCVVRQDFGEEAIEEQGQGQVMIAMPVVFIASVYVTPSDRDETPIDQILNNVWADVTKCLATVWSDESSGIGSLAYNWTVLAPEIEESDDRFNRVRCRYQAMVRFNELDPYTQR